MLNTKPLLPEHGSQALPGKRIGSADQGTDEENTITSEEQELLEQYLTHLDILGRGKGPNPTSMPGTRKYATP